MKEETSTAISGKTRVEMQSVARLFPRLSAKLHKGQCGRIGIIGGSPEYTGAPYFSAMTAMRIGADLSYVFTHPQAASVIKSYSPELIVFPSMSFEQMRPTLEKLHSLVIGAGLGRDKAQGVPLMRQVLEYARQNPRLAVVVDADGLFMLPDCLKDSKDRYTNVLLTPNANEFRRLFAAMLPEEDEQMGNDRTRVKMLAQKLGMCVMLKGAEETISDGQKVLIGSLQGSHRRCGGIGDILGGATALFVYWHHLLSTNATQGDYTTEDMLEGAKAASNFVRHATRRTFETLGRSMVAGDVISKMPEV